MNDDLIMLTLVDELAKEGITVIDQQYFLEELLAKAGTLGKYHPMKTNYSI